MTSTATVQTVATDIAHRTADAYSFSYYGARSWLACVEMLLARGYNPIETECILRSKITRWATDTIETRRRATAADLAYAMDERMGGPHGLADYIADTVLAQMAPETEKLDSREALRLVYSRA